jgi:hypothetical protein
MSGSPARRPPSRTELSREERGRVLKAAALRPLNVLVLVIGAGISLSAQLWWVIPLALATYASLVLLASRDPVFAQRTLGNVEQTSGPGNQRELSPERRARWLPRGETRTKVESALETYRKVVADIESADEVARAVLEGSIPRLHDAADRLVKVAHNRERAAAAIRELKDATDPKILANRQEIEEELRLADAEISATSERLLALRSSVARVLVSSGPEARAAATELNASLNEINFRLEALGETMSDESRSSDY